MNRVSMNGSDILLMRRLSPNDKEISFNLEFDTHGNLQNVKHRVGHTCDPNAGNCSIQSLPGYVSAHTHPKGERVSSADLMVSIKKHPELGGDRKLSFVIAPKGFYCYSPTKVITDKFKNLPTNMQQKLQKYIKWVGHQLQDDTQNGNVAEFVTFVKELGFNISYHPYNSFLPTDNFVFKLD